MRGRQAFVMAYSHLGLVGYPSYVRGRGAIVMARSHLGPVGYPSYGVTRLWEYLSGLWNRLWSIF